MSSGPSGEGGRGGSDLREWLSALAVVVGLVFLGYELRQNTTVQRITATQTLATAYADAVEGLDPAGPGQVRLGPPCDDHVRRAGEQLH